MNRRQATAGAGESGTYRRNGLEIDEDLEFQRRSWKAQRVSWMVMVLVALAALLGLFGTGPFSSATTGGAGSPLRIEYERFARHKSPTLLRVHVAAEAARDGQARLWPLRIWIDRHWVESVQIQQITPLPERAEAAGDRVIYTFNVAEPNQPVTIAFHATTHRIGLVEGRAGIEAGPYAGFRQFVYP